MASYRIFENDELINTIEADEAFCKTYCEKNGYTYEAEPEPEPEVEPELEATDTEVINALLGVNV